jgi:VanZ family protein
MASEGRGIPRWLLNWAPAALAIAMIAGESTATMSASDTSRWLLPIWVYLFGPITAAHWAVVHFFLRKSGHFIGYGLVSLACFHGWRSSLADSDPRRLWRRAAAWALVCTLIVAAADEYHQSFLPSRGAAIHDVVLDLCGGIAAQLLLRTLAPRLFRHSSLWAVL